MGDRSTLGFKLFAIPLKSVWMNKGGHSSFGNAFNPLTTVSKLFAAKKLKAQGTSIAHFTFSSFASVKPPIASGACDLDHTLRLRSGVLLTQKKKK